MSVTPLPTLDRTDPNFRTDVDTFFGTELPTFSVEVEALRLEVLASESNAIAQASTATTQAGIATTQAGISTAQAVISTTQAGISTTQAGLAAASAASAVNSPGTSATSTTSLIIGTGAKSLTIQTGKLFTVGQTIVIARTSVPSTQMTGVITSHNSGTGALAATVATGATSGSGTYTDWTISLSGIQGIQGPAPLSAGVPIGGLVAKKESGSSFVDGDATWLRTGTLVATATYPLAPTTTINDAATWTTKTSTSMTAPQMASNGTGTIICTDILTSTSNYDVSVDGGDTWSSVALPTTMASYPVWCGTFFLLVKTVATTTTFYTSTTGLAGSWTARTVASDIYSSAVYGDAGCIITGSTTNALKTKDGISYTNIAMPFALMNGVFGNGFYVFMRASTSPLDVYKTYTGASFLNLQMPQVISDTGAGFPRIAYGNGLFVYVQNIGATIVSGFSTEDFNDFNIINTSITPAAGVTFNITYGNGAFLLTRYASTNTTLAYISIDNGVTWSSVTIPSSSLIKAAISTGTGFLAKLASSTTLYKSVSSVVYTDTQKSSFSDGLEKKRPYYMRVA